DASTGPVYLWVAPTKRGGSCQFLQVVGTELPGGRPNLSGGCSITRPSFGFGLSTTRVHDGRLLALLHGRAAPPARSVRVRFANGSHRVFALSRDGYLLAEVSSHDSVREVT